VSSRPGPRRREVRTSRAPWRARWPAWTVPWRAQAAEREHKSRRHVSSLGAGIQGPPSAGVAASGAVALVLIALIAVLVPLPTLLIDLLLVGALAFGVALLVAALTVERPHELSGFPALLLGATLLRLAVNVSTTRRILGSADAGRVVDAFASVVAGSDLVVGLVVFGIVTMLQWIVVARGAERIAEVAARFSLDAMPGEQAAVDVDLRAGSISSTEAALRRSRVVERARFHGAMDGAMRFVKGDVLLGMAITATNLAGGLIIGLSRQGMSVVEALEVYGRLTIGDGLAMQIPSVLTSLAAGLLVARTERGSGGHESRLPRVQVAWLATPALLCVALAAIPGMPAFAFLLVGVTLGGLAFSVSTRLDTPLVDEDLVEVELPGTHGTLTPGLVHALVQQVGHELGLGAVRCSVSVNPAQGTSGPEHATIDKLFPLSVRVRIAGRELEPGGVVCAVAPHGARREAPEAATVTPSPARAALVSLRGTILKHADGLADLRWIETRLHSIRSTDPSLVDRALRRVDALELLAFARHLLRERIPVPELAVILRVVVERIDRAELEPREGLPSLARTRLSPWWLPELVESLGGVDEIRWFRTTPDLEDAAATLAPLTGKRPVEPCLAELPRTKLAPLRAALATVDREGPAVVLTGARVRSIVAAVAREVSPRVWVVSLEEVERGAPREPGHTNWLELPARGS